MVQNTKHLNHPLQYGSLLFWLFILSIFSTITIIQNQNKHHQLMPWVIISLTITQMFFLILTNYVTNPFKPTEADFVVVNGNGLNPLLQNITMAIHPPTLYLGYVGFSVPFAFAISALVNRDTSPLWIQSIRRWVLVLEFLTDPFIMCFLAANPSFIPYSRLLASILFLTALAEV